MGDDTVSWEKSHPSSQPYISTQRERYINYRYFNPHYLTLSYHLDLIIILKTTPIVSVRRPLRRMLRLKCFWCLTGPNTRRDFIRFYL
jgi:hypothetical protein